MCCPLTGAVLAGALSTLNPQSVTDHITAAWEGLSKNFNGWQPPEDVFAKLAET